MAATSTALEKVVALESALERGDAAATVHAAEDAVRNGPFGPTHAALTRAMTRFPAEARLGDLLLELHQRFKDWDAFEAAFRRLVAQRPRRAELHYVAGKAREERGMTCGAIREFGRAWRIDPDDLDAVVRMARLFRAGGKPFLARRRLRRALAIHPDAAALHANMGYCYVEDAQPRKAVAEFYKAVALEPDESPFLDELGVALLVAERWKEAAAMAVRSLRARPGREKGWTVYAVAHRHLGNVEQAEKGYRNAFRYAKEASRARGNLGLFLAGRPGRSDEAADHLRAALDAHPDWDAVRDALDGLAAP